MNTDHFVSESQSQNKELNSAEKFYSRGYSPTKSGDGINTFEIIYMGRKYGCRKHHRYVYSIENNTWICGNMKFISSVDQDISRVSEILFIIYKKFPYYPAKIALNHNAESAIIVTCEIITSILVAEKSIKSKTLIL